MRFGLIIAAAGVLYSSSGFGQLPPPPPDVWKAQLAFFSSLPDRFPVADTTQFEQLVANDVQVYRDCILVHKTRADWMREIQSYKQKMPTDPQGFYVSRDQYTLLADGGVSVREFTYPIPPEGKTTFYHPDYPLRYVYYRISNGRLVRVDYGMAMSDYAGLCQEVATIKEKSGGRWMELCR
jgi:hypothetical protein